MLPMHYVVIDGNHRVCKQINENNTIINAYFASEYVTILSLMNQFQVCLYSFLLDVCKIIYNYGKIKDGIIRNNLNIYNKESALYIALNRK